MASNFLPESSEDRQVQRNADATLVLLAAPDGFARYAKCLLAHGRSGPYSTTRLTEELLAEARRAFLDEFA